MRVGEPNWKWWNAWRQLEIIADMQFRKQSTGSAENLLFNFDRSLRAHKAHLEQLTTN